jgi:nucleotide-binding universal stress UspA family protein
MSRRNQRPILVPTDGSRRALRAGRVAAALARKLHAPLTAVYVVVEGVPSAFSAGLYASPALSTANRALLRAQAERALAAVEDAARRQGVACTRRSTQGPRPWQAIVNTARRRGCRLIVMGSHGRGGMAGALLGSQTTQVLAHSRIPVLVCR